MRELMIDEIVSVSGGADSPKEEVNVWAQRSQDGGGGGSWLYFGGSYAGIFGTSVYSSAEDTVIGVSVGVGAGLTVGLAGNAQDAVNDAPGLHVCPGICLTDIQASKLGTSDFNIQFSVGFGIWYDQKAGSLPTTPP